MHVRSVLVACAIVAGSAVPASVAQAGVTEYPVPTPSANFDQITPGPDGALWFTERVGKIGRITTSGTVTEFPIPGSSIPQGIVAGPDGALWFTDILGKIGRITTAGAVTEYTVPDQTVEPRRIARGPDGALWFTGGNGVGFPKIGRITTSGQITEFTVPSIGAELGDIVSGPDGALWFSEVGVQGQVDRITTAGHVTEFPLPVRSIVGGLARGPDGALWVTESYFGRVARLTTAGAFTEFTIPFGSSPTGDPTGTAPGAITSGPDGALWFAFQNSKIGRITTSGDVSQLRLRSTGLGPTSIAPGPDGALWFTDGAVNSIGRVSAGPLPAVDSVNGGFATAPPCGLRCFPPTYSLDISSGPGEAVLGEASFESGTIFTEDLVAEQGTPTCLHTSGNHATVGVNFTGDGPAPARGALIFLEHNGPTGDRAAVVNLPAGTAPTTCPAQPPAGVTLAVVAGGDVLVTDAGPATCIGREATRVGTAGDDTLRGTPGADVIVGGDGNDVILGLGGDDVVCAGAGDDRVWGGEGNDVVFAGTGDDRVRGGRGADYLIGEEGNDRLWGAPGDDILVGATGFDRCESGLGAGVKLYCESP